MIRLGINIDHVATLRQARMESYPDPVQSAIFAELGGADNITCHLREDRRHIQDRDVKLLKDTINIPMNFEMAATNEMLDFACEIRPHAVTLVPEKREELTTEGGLNIEKNKDLLKDSISRLQEETGCLVSLFVDPTEKASDLSKEIGAEALEFHTGDFCKEIVKCKRTKEQYDLIRPLEKVSNYASSLGLQVHFGHGLTYTNAQWLQLISKAEEANIGHSVISRALFVGLEKAVFEMKELLNNKKHRPNPL